MIGGARGPARIDLCPHCAGTGFVRYQFDAAALVKSLADTFGIKTHFSSKEAVALIVLEARLGTAKKLGQALRKIAGRSFDGLVVECIGSDRDGAVWWIAMA